MYSKSSRLINCLKRWRPATNCLISFRRYVCLVLCAYSWIRCQNTQYSILSLGQRKTNNTQQKTKGLNGRGSWFLPENIGKTCSWIRWSTIAHLTPSRSLTHKPATRYSTPISHPIPLLSVCAVGVNRKYYKDPQLVSLELLNERALQPTAHVVTWVWQCVGKAVIDHQNDRDNIDHQW